MDVPNPLCVCNCPQSDHAADMGPCMNPGQPRCTMFVEQIDFSIYRGNLAGAPRGNSPEDVEADRSEICAVDYPGEGVRE